MPSASPFARIFQFGMRLGMRSYTLGSAWWQGDCGPFWGHNAIVRIAPFIRLRAAGAREGAGEGHILSHDQIEAVLMRKAGYEVRVLAEEGSSFEQNPPTLLEFLRRDLRWCQGNMQYWPFLGARPPARQSLSASSRHSDVSWLSGMDWSFSYRICRTRNRPYPVGFHARRCRNCASMPDPRDVVCAQYSNRHRCARRPKLCRLFGGSIRFAASFILAVVSFCCWLPSAG